MLIGKNEFGFKRGAQIVCKQNSSGVYVSAGGLLKKHYLVNIENAKVIDDPDYKGMIPNNKTVLMAQIGSALGPVGTALGSAIGDRMDTKSAAEGGAIQLTYSDGSTVDLLCSKKDIERLAQSILEPLGVTISV
jgi:hypothetical protein